MSEPKELKLAGNDPSAAATYNFVKAADIEYVEIFPPVGITRFGDSVEEYFYAPEVPGRTSPPDGITTFRDAAQRIRRQAVRFRVYAYNAANELLGEINDKVAIENGSSSKYALKWTVHVANKKGAYTGFQGRYTDPPITALRNPKVQKNLDPDLRTNLIVDPAVQPIPTSTGSKVVNLKGTFQGSNASPTDVYLGQLQVDTAGRLIFVPGTGDAKSIKDPSEPHPEVVSEFDSVDWVDTACDGWVKVKVTATSFDKDSRHPATVISAPPNFAWGINLPTTLYDIMEDIYWRKGAAPTERMITALTYDFRKDIWPVLKSASLISWTNNAALQGHGPSSNGHFSSDKVIKLLKSDNAERKSDLKTRIFEKLREPDYGDPSQVNAWYMPRLSGDSGDMPDPGQFPSGLQPDIKRFAALTRLQYVRFRKWKDDATFTLPNGWLPEPTQLKIEDFTEHQPEYLSRASLESTVGDPLFPGIEMYWLAKELSTYDLNVSNLNPPFRVNSLLKPGHLTRGLSLPWQSDFVLCATHWWPSVRPDDVVPKVAYDNIMSTSGTQKRFDTVVKTRKGWARGLRETIDLGQTRTTTNIPWFGNTDMARYWNRLGIVRKDVKEYADPNRTYTAYVESERLEF